ncbi:MAG TPA: long-chain fatty acid--CoA ligase [Ktedonobacterales bacterium]|nr:long-chain fatty acid--CoA ligase [Ktedonobacterales bacterium]
MNVGDMLANSAAQYPDKTAIIFRDQPTNYAEFNLRANQVANGLIDLGVRKGDRVGLLLHNIPLFLEAYYGVLKAGAVVVPMNVLYKQGEVAYIMRDCGAKALLTFAPFAPVALAAASECPDLKHVIVAAPVAVPGALSWAQTIGAAPATPPHVEVREDDLAVLSYTSGTTGRPKGAMLTHGNLLANIEENSDIQQIKISSDDVVWLGLPLFHIYGMNVGMNNTIHYGGTMLVVERFEPLATLEDIQKHRVTVIYGAPPMFIAWSQVPTIRETDFSSVRFISSGAAALPVAIIGLFQELTHAPITEGYGLSEASPVLTTNAAGPYTKPGTVGPAIPGVEIKIVDDAGNEVPHGEMGELIARGPNIMVGYWNQPQATADTLRDGWLYTGDLATEDEDGYITIVDRKKDMIVVSGYNVYPREVEEMLYQHPAVADAAVVQYPDPYQGESVLAFVVRKEGQNVSAQELIDFCRSQIAVFKCPRRIEFVDELPKNNTGKVLRRQLRDQANQLAQTSQAS